MIRQIANRYILGNLIGQGGMADVYKATDIILNREVAVKILRSKLSDDPMILVRFQREASAASRLSHPNVVDIYDVGEYEGMHYIVMEYIRGRTLKQLVLRRGAIDVDEAVGIMKQLTSAVADAHHHSIIHRDIKPQNVLVKDDGTVKITDFGIAVATGNVALTHNNAVMGSAHYLSPESAQGKAPDERVDIYSLGIVFFELLTGQVPFAGETPAGIALKHLQTPMPDVREFHHDLPQSVANIVIRATAKDPQERYQSARQMLDDLNVCLNPAHTNDPAVVLKTKVLDLAGNPVTSKEETGGTAGKGTGHRPGRRRRRLSLSHLLATIGGSIAAALLICWLILFLGVVKVDGLMGYHALPSLTGQSEEQAVETLKDMGIEDVSISQSVSDSVEAGEVIESEPKAGTLVKKNQPVSLVISKGPSFLIPDWTGVSLEEVYNNLRDTNIKVRVIYQGMANTNPSIVLEQHGLMAGDRVDPDDSSNEIELVISTYPSLVLPESLIGMDPREAKNYLNEQGIAVVIVDRYGSDEVVEMDPPAGTEYTQYGTDNVVTLYQ